MKVNIDSTLIFRTPKFSYTDELGDCWDELKAAIALSSTSFYETIKDVNVSGLDALPPKIYFTIWKYFNRAKFRSTPYGTFASFTILENAIDENKSQIVINERQKLTELLDWPLKNNIQFNINDLLNKNCLLFSNSSYYLTPQSCRYIACTDGVFELAEIDKNEEVLQILAACLTPLRVNDLVTKLGLENEALPELYELLQDMHELQLIFTAYDPNIIGEDYFDRIGIKSDEQAAKYIIAERHAQTGALNNPILRALPGLIDLLHHSIRQGERTALQQFVRNFKKRFEDKEVPLLQALDPELGVGYDDLEQAGTNDDLIAQLSSKKNKEADVDDLKSLLSQQLSAQKFNSADPILLNKLPLKPLEKVNPLPNSVSVLMSVVDDLIFIDQIGGTTANALSGRFTMASSKVEAYCKATAQREQSANEDVLFFDVAYMVEANIDNINRRKLVYDHQLSILNFDTSAEPLTLNDIQIAMRGSDIILRSKKLNRRIVPKMASAYNYSRSDLSVFRLLCDLQHHRQQTNLSVSLESLFPNLRYYPRLQYHNIILSASKWKIDKQNLTDTKQQFFSVNDCRTYLKSLGVNGLFKTGVSDQTLCFDVESDNDVSAFLQYMQKQTSVYLEEVVLPINSAVVDEAGKPYMAQFILNLYHQNKIYNSILPQSEAPAVQEIFPPGKEWLYFEVFCHQQRADQLLVEIVSPFVTAHQQHIKSWFFIRYNENGDHIRFRILLNDERDGQKLTSLFVNDLDAYLAAGLISDIQIKTYKREVNRYGADLIGTVETHFCADSKYILSLIETQPDNFSKYKLCSSLVEHIQASKVLSADRLAKVIKHVSDAFNEEHRLEPADFKKLNSQYQQFRKLENVPLTAYQAEHFEGFATSLVSTLGSASEQNREKLFSDLIHMHVNRLFNKDQRTHEMVIHYFLLKDIQRVLAMQR
ncbi:lantibiotic dehydratase [Pedobacter endophyticus]|uniref:Thiopeptide-type bacteriocin biosynthesis protein n=1 Tax=Pedobacter endophyticus TaxID=2789740 RepID=A0A7U3SQN2_9SPHI|nr:lantibiotic dehydratase [Pedobacter endophyticus]QPH38531.1 thiopeptide-type bacteriocin biosynthesis protein [Pedobacter endophyticus]